MLTSFIKFKQVVDITRIMDSFKFPVNSFAQLSELMSIMINFGASSCVSVASLLLANEAFNTSVEPRQRFSLIQMVFLYGLL